MEGLILVAVRWLPAILFFAYASLRKRYAFRPLAIAAALMVLARAGLEFWQGGLLGGGIVLAQGVVAALAFFVMVLFLGKKVAGETSVLLCATIALAPFGLGFFITLFGGLIGATIAAARKWTQVSGESIRDLGVQSAIDMGVMTRSKPDLSRLPEKNEKVASLRVSTAPWYLLAAAASAGIAVLIAYL